MSLPDVRIALSIASQVNDLDLRARHLARARALVNRMADELAQVSGDLRAHEKELERLTVAAKQPSLPGVSK